MKTKLLIVDDHPLTRAGVRTILETNKTIEIIGDAKDGLEAIEQVGAQLPQGIHTRREQGVVPLRSAAR